MNQDRTKRKLTAILSADVVGYSRLMSEDEDATLRTLTSYIDRVSYLIKHNNGNVVKTTGDGVLAEFASAVDAVKCSVEIQQEIKHRNAELIESRRMEFRIGIHIGDIIEQNGDIFGDGVNIAARVEGLADPGYIFITRNVYDQVRRKLPYDYEFRGERKVKNIDEPVPVYRVLMDSEAAEKVVDKKEHRGPSIKIIVIVLFIIIAGLLIWRFYPTQRQTPTTPEVEKAPKTIAVLPFENLSPEKDQEYFADGIAEELLNSLSRISGLEVRGRTSSFYFKGKDMDLPTISKMLNVEYILEGSVRKSGEEVRITVQLIKTQKDAHLWSKTYDRELKDIFAIQDDIAQSVADALQITLEVGALGRMPGMTRNIDAYDAFLAGRSLRLQSGRENNSQAIKQLEQAVALDPDFAIGWNELASAYSVAPLLIPERGEEWEAKYEEVLSRANKLFLERFPESNLALIIAAGLSGDRMEEERLYNKALAVDPENYDTNFSYGMFLLEVGRPTEAIDYFQRCVRMEPLASWAYANLGLAYEFSGNSDAVAMTFKKGKELASDPTIFNIGLLVLAMEKNDRTLIGEYVALLGSDAQEINLVMHTLLDKPEEALAELRRRLNDPAYINSVNRSVIAAWASYFGEHEIALQIYRGFMFTCWRPIHKGMRQLPGFKDLVQEFGLVDYWRTSGKWGDFCHPVGENDFECD
jgi:adenylate cyclase